MAGGAQREAIADIPTRTDTAAVADDEDAPLRGMRGHLSAAIVGRRRRVADRSDEVADASMGVRDQDPRSHRAGIAGRPLVSDFAVTTKPAETVLFGQFTTRQRCTGCWTGSTNWASRWLSSDSGPRPAGASALLDDGRPPAA
jgi:hypothetical protein